MQYACITNVCRYKNSIETNPAIKPPAVVRYLIILLSFLINIEENIPNNMNPTMPYHTLLIPNVFPNLLVCTVSHPLVPVIAEQKSCFLAASCLFSIYIITENNIQINDKASIILYMV